MMHGKISLKQVDYISGFMMTERKTVQIKISLTSEEYEILKELSVLEGKTMAGFFMHFLRQACLFDTFKNVLERVRKVHTSIN